VFGYRHLRSLSPERLWRDKNPAALSYRELRPSGRSILPLPRNVPARDRLRRECPPRTQLAFHDVPELPHDTDFVATLRNCTVVRHVDEGKNEWYAVVSPGDVNLRFPGVGFGAAHRAAWASRADSRRIARGVWVLQQWYPNHFHWLTDNLTRVVTARQWCPGEPLLLPDRSVFTPVMRDSLSVLGMSDGEFLNSHEACWRVDELTLVHVDPFRADVFETMRRAFTRSDRRPYRRLYFSRRRAGWRRVTNEADVERTLENYGFETVFLEDLDFAGQVSLMAEAAAIASPHGAGLSNVIFAPASAGVLEFMDTRRPEPIYYALSATLGHNYYVLDADPVGGRPGGYCDLHVPLEPLQRTVEQLLRDLES
jgi:hypothetical protein